MYNINYLKKFISAPGGLNMGIATAPAQFGLVFTNPLLDASLEAKWSTVNYTIAMFAITSWLYRHTLSLIHI